MLASLGNSWHFVETHKHPPEDPLYCKEAKQRIRTNKSGAHEPLSLSPPTGYHLGTTCSWPIASRCRFAMGFCKHSYLAKTSANPGLLCTRIHKHRHLHCLGNFKCFNGCFVIMSGETERFIQR